MLKCKISPSCLFLGTVGLCLALEAPAAWAGGVVITNGKDGGKTSVAGENAPRGSDAKRVPTSDVSLSSAALLTSYSGTAEEDRPGTANGTNTTPTIIGGIAWDAEPEFICPAGDSECDDGYGGCGAVPASGLSILLSLAFWRRRRR